MIRLGTIVMGAQDVDRAVQFWSQALGYDPVTFDNSDNDFTILIPPEGIGTRIALQKADTPPQAHPRVHLDVIVDDAAEQDAEVERLVALGGSAVAWDMYPDDADFVVLADPEGNRFCVVNAGHPN
ncbi:MAG: VOC family protein [Acidimicrobiia bacterium]